MLSPREDFYRTVHPEPEHSLLLVEVAKTSLRHDRGRKLPVYARTGVPEVWIVNRRADAVEVYRAPSIKGHQERDVVGRGGHIAPAAFPDCRLLVDDILA